MKIKVCGMRDAENIQQVIALGVNMIGLIFWPKSPRYVQSFSTNAGIIPDLKNPAIKDISNPDASYVGVFVDEMPQNVVTHAYNYKLDYIQLHGNESPIYIDNLRKTLVPDILPNVKIIKALSINEKSDVLKWKTYEGHVDMFLFDTKSTQTVGGTGKHFDWSLINMYDGNIPFLLSGGIGPDDAEAVKSFKHPMCVGIDLNSRFEKEPGMKDVDKLKAFLKALA
jgi:phosphoribosylanthranilate isomerase